MNSVRLVSTSARRALHFQRLELRTLHKMASPSTNDPDYSAWSHERLIGRVLELESQVRNQINSYTPNSRATAPANES
jgi:hypothetical protein